LRIPRETFNYRPSSAMQQAARMPSSGYSRRASHGMDADVRLVKADQCDRRRGNCTTGVYIIELLVIALLLPPPTIARPCVQRAAL